MKKFIIALQFLTILPLSRDVHPTSQELGQSMGYFPLVGLFLGFILASSHYLLSLVLPVSVADGGVILVLIICTGALHLDGLADTVDGIAGGSTREESLEIMRDNVTGAIGVVSLIMILLLKYVSLISIPDPMKTSALIALPVISRYSMVQMSFFSHYARKGSGIGVPFTSYIEKKELMMAFVTSLFLSIILLGINGISVLLIICLSTWGLSTFFDKRIGGATGDTYGATNEINEVLVLTGILALLNCQ